MSFTSLTLLVGIQLLFIQLCNGQTLSVCQSTNWNNNYRGELALTNNCEGKNPSNYWLSPYKATGDKAYITIDLGKVTNINRILVKNTHNGNSEDGGSKSITVSTSASSCNGPWIERTANQILPDARRKGCNAVQVEYLPIPRTDARYVKLVVNSYYGAAAGLQYFSADDAGPGGAGSDSNPLPEGVKPITGCDCTEYKETNHLGRKIGACLSRSRSKFWCYIENGSASTCPDKKASSRPGGRWWSSKACAWYVDDEPLNGK